MRKLKCRFKKVLATRWTAFWVSIITVGIGIFYFINPFILADSKSYEVINIVSAVIGKYGIPIAFVTIGSLKLLSLIFDWKIKKTFLNLLIILYAVMFIGFLIQNFNGAPNTGFLFTFGYFLVLIGVLNEEEIEDGFKN